MQLDLTEHIKTLEDAIAKANDQWLNRRHAIGGTLGKQRQEATADAQLALATLRDARANLADAIDTQNTIPLTTPPTS